MTDIIIDVNLSVDKCPICLDIIDETSEKYSITDCNHVYCCDCLKQLMEQNVIKCPICRSEIKSYKNQNDNFHLIKINENTNENTNENAHANREINIMLLRLHNRICYYKFISLIIFIYSIDLYYDYLVAKNDINNMEMLYKNCTLYLEDIEGVNEQLINKDMLSMGVLFDNVFRMCSFPKYFVNKCITEYY